MYEYKITVFTPTYNRAYTLGRLYESLKKQTVKTFEWIVIDDGSVDETKNLFEIWCNEENEFKINYVKVENGGKHRAINKGIEISNGELFFIVDSDDYLTEDSLEKIIEWESNIENKEEFAGVSGNIGYSIDKVIGKELKQNFIDATSLQRDALEIEGDKAEVFYTKILKKYKFPEIEGENFITERVLWDKIAFDGYKIRWVNQIIYITEYLEDGLSHSLKNILVKNPKGYALDLKTQMKYRNYSLKKKMAAMGSYYYTLKRDFTLKEISGFMNINYYLYMIVVFMWSTKMYLLRKLDEN